MSGNFKLEVVTPERIVVDEEAQMAIAPGVFGEFGVLVGHTPFLSSLKLGSLQYKDAGGQERFVFINSGFAEVLPNKVTVLAESAERRKDIDVKRAEAALERAQKRIAEAKEDLDAVRAEAAMARALQRLKIIRN